MYSLLRPILFRLDPERAHMLTLVALRAAQNFSPALWMLHLMYAAPEKPVNAFGLNFRNPIGLAAGYDKDGVAIRGLSALGFSHVEIGTVTLQPQDGNPKPRVFRLPEDEAVINRMGFPSRGSVRVRQQLKSNQKINAIEYALGRAPRRLDVILGINLGKNRTTPNEEAVLDYLALLENFASYADYLTINVSSPNTVGLRQLQGRAALEGLLTQLHAQRKHEEARLKKRLPLLVKLAPDLTDPELDDALDVILRTGMDGVIATNTTLARDGVRSALAGEAGGLSGSPLRVRSEAMLEKTVRRLDGRLPVVSAGGIMNPEDAKRRLDLGAALIQIYTGLVYRGPGFVKAIARML